MKIKTAIAVLFFISFSAYGLDIYLNDSFFAAYSREELHALSIPSNDSGTTEIWMWDLLPLMSSVQYIEGISRGGRFVWEEEKAEDIYRTSKLQLDENGLAMYGEGNRLAEPTRINIYGTPLDTDGLIVWIFNNNPWLEQEIKTFGRLHKIRIIIETHQNPWYDFHDPRNDETLPDIVIIDGRTAYMWQEGAASLDENLYTGEREFLPNISETWFLPLAYRMPLILRQQAEMENEESEPLYGDFFGEDWFIAVTGSLFLRNSPVFDSESRDYIRQIITETKKQLESGSFVQTHSDSFPANASNRFYPSDRMSEAIQYMNEGSGRTQSLTTAFAIEGNRPLPLDSLAAIIPLDAGKESEILIQYLRGPAVQYGIGNRTDWFSAQEITNSDKGIISDDNEFYLYWGSSELEEKARAYSSMARLYYNNLLSMEELMVRMFPD